MIRTQIVFDYRGRTKKGNEGPIEVRVSANGKHYYIPTGVRVRRSEFAFGAVINRGDSDELNEQLQVILRKITAEVTSMLNAGDEIDAAEIKRRVWSAAKPVQGNEVVAWIESQLPYLGLREGTLKHYRPLLSRLEDFGEIRAWRDVTIENIYKFDAWLHEQQCKLNVAQIKAGVKPHALGDAGVYNYHKTFKAMLNRALRLGMISENPYSRLRGQFRRGERDEVDYLTEDEMIAFQKFCPMAGTQMELAHDLFVFQMYTGLGFSDMQNFNMKDYRKVDGTWRNNGQRIKTGVSYVSQLLPPAVAVLEKYGRKIPAIDNADYNHCLKILGAACGIEKPLHSHMARHTFATYALRKGVKIENLSRMLGHTNITQTQRYAKVVAQSVHEDFDLLAKSLTSNQ